MWKGLWSESSIIGSYPNANAASSRTLKTFSHSNLRRSFNAGLGTFHLRFGCLSETPYCRFQRVNQELFTTAAWATWPRRKCSAMYSSMIKFAFVMTTFEGRRPLMDRLMLQNHSYSNSLTKGAF